MFIIVLFCISAAADPSAAPVVDLGHLHVHGLQVPDSTGAQCNVYLGVPFAQPPVGSLRWANPEPYVLPKTSTHFFAQKLPKQCPQILPVAWLFDMMLHSSNDYNNISSSEFGATCVEDCLYLNVFVPDNNSTNRPVMVWIHGGAFISGSTLGYDARALAISQDVVVVVIQYRLGVFGFLSTSDSAASGNFGLKDQTLALQWVQSHIGAFGGDTARVTIFGESAGAISVAMHTVSPYSAGLYKNAILHSGTEHMGTIYTQEPLPMAQHLARQVGCDTSDSSQLIQCLRGKTQQQILDGTTGMTLENLDKFQKGLMKDFEFMASTSFFPTAVDGEFFTEHPMTTKHVNPGNMVVGFNSDEVGFVMAGVFGLDQPLTREELASKLESIALILTQGNPDYTSKILEKFRLAYAATDDTHANKKIAQKAKADAMFIGNAFIKAQNHLTAGHKVYMYELLRGITYFQDHSLVDALLVNMSRMVQKPADLGGDHGDDVFFTLGYPFNPNFERSGYKTTDGDRMISALMMQFWGEFARTGTIRGWPEFTAERRTVLQLDRQEPFLHIAHDPIPEVLSLWTVQIPALLKEMERSTAKAKQDL